MNNLAQRVRPLLVVLLLCVAFAGATAATKKPPLKPVNINTANSEELQQVPGIGPATAEKILQMRKSYGLFKSVDDLLAIRGIGKKRLEKMRKYLTVSKSAALSRNGPSATSQVKNTPVKKEAPTPAADPEEPPQRQL